MKLRLRGNSLRLRLQQKEVGRLLEMGSVVEEVHFHPLSVFTYRLECSSEIETLEASAQNNTIRVKIPYSLASEWALSDQVSLSAEQGELKLLVEKDFKCINPNRVWQEDESDAFPNPNPSCGGGLHG